MPFFGVGSWSIPEKKWTIYPTLRSDYIRVSRTTVYRIRLILTPRSQWRYQVLTPEEWDSGITAEDEDIQVEENETELAKDQLEVHDEVVVEEEEEEEDEEAEEDAVTDKENEVASEEATTSRSGRRVNRSWRSVEEGY